MSKLLTLAATGVAGLALGAGIGVAAAAQDGPEPAPTTDASWMDEMHADMRDEMPRDLRQQCDEQHAAMGDHHEAHHLGTGS